MVQKTKLFPDGFAILFPSVKVQMMMCPNDDGSAGSRQREFFKATIVKNRFRLKIP